MKILVAGATGETGRLIVKELVKRNIAVRAMVRDLEKAKEILPANVDYVVADLQKKETLEVAIADCDYVISAAASRPSLNIAGFYQVDYVGTKNLIDVAEAKGIKQFILVTSLCTSKFFHPLNIFGLVLFWKKQAEEYLIGSSLKYTIVRPGGLSTEKIAPVVVSGADTLFEGRIPRQLVAEICVAALGDPHTLDQVIEAVTDEKAPEKPYAELFEAIAS
ncbi:SDR family oxidoreductase [[Limnothrix rosea] IAM M-220]|uniref:SDR family oxidoreductase n=1 Tax=[Limnothrix rosea] IAM M-220 TaxID=454133 RepID=UPI00095957E7|nr:SDR family oxidoreductase [[Limnothrix rosea] IAM M-220]OKH17379.1 epimerase [[Limnothrix rosea] IAM M-220]